jgi:hypothetical protein
MKILRSSTTAYLRLTFFNIRFLGNFGFFVLLASTVKPINLNSLLMKSKYKVMGFSSFGGVRICSFLATCGSLLCPELLCLLARARHLVFFIFKGQSPRVRVKACTPKFKPRYMAKFPKNPKIATFILSRGEGFE